MSLRVVAGEMPDSEFGLSLGTVPADVRGVITTGMRLLYSCLFSGTLGREVRTSHL